MPGKPTILVQDQPDDGRTWRKFVAVLCLIEFYTQFVLQGHALADLIQNRPSNKPLSDAEFYELLHSGAAFLRAIAFFGLGRALWYGNGPVRRWLWRGVLLSLVCIGIRCVQVIEVPQTGEMLVWIGQDRYTQFSNPAMPILLTNIPDLFWIVLLMAVAWYAGHDTCRNRRSHPWVIFAAIWCVSSISACLILPINITWIEKFGWWRQDWFPVVVIATLLATAVCLLMHWQIARTLALLSAALELACVGLDMWFLPSLMYYAVQSVRMSHGLDPYISPWMYLLWNDHSFRVLSVDLIANVGPWLLIAFYAWRVPMRPLPEDDSPYPRRFCARCYYNLRGNVSDRCPECGMQLAPLVRESLLAPTQAGIPSREPARLRSAPHTPGSAAR